MVGNQSTGSGLSLYKYSGTDLSIAEEGYPIPNAELSAADSISWHEGTLYCHNGSILSSAIGEINTSTGAVTSILSGDSFDSSLPDLVRTTKLERTAGGYHTTYYAPGDVWCEYRILDTGGDCLKSYYCPTNATGPIAVSGSYRYLIENYPNRLYIISGDD